VQQLTKNYFFMTGKPIDEQRLFQYRFPVQLWTNIRNFVRNLGELALWANKDLSQTVFGGKQNMSYWQTIFETGKTPSGVQVMPKGINLVEMIK
jgi:hypothetical protein